jgi:hypothetical protein
MGSDSLDGVLHVEVDARLQCERESSGKFRHALPKRANPATQIVGGYLESEQSAGLARFQLDEAATIEAKGALHLLFDDVLANAGFERKSRYDLAAGDEALRTVLHDEAVASLTTQLPADVRARLE